MSYWGNKFITVCKWLGVDYVKKYFPLGGSYWRKHHIDKDSKYDMEYVIDTTYFSNIFIASSSLTTSCMMIYMATDPGKISYAKLNGRILLGALGIYGYMLMLNHYNRILAKRRLTYIKNEEYLTINNNTQQAYIMPINNNNEEFEEFEHPVFQISSHQYISLYAIGFMDYRPLKSPPFKTFDDAIAFIAYIDTLVESTDIVDYWIYLYCHDIKDLYMEYISEMMDMTDSDNDEYKSDNSNSKEYVVTNNDVLSIEI